MEVEELADAIIQAIDDKTLFLAIERAINRMPEDGKGARLRALGRCVTDTDWYLKEYHASDLRR